MKRNIIFVIVAVAALLLSFSCTKQDETPSKTFRAVIERELTKTTVGDFDIEIGGYPIAWSNGDRVMIKDAVYSAVYSAVPDKEKPQEAELEFVEGTIPAAPYTAVFPASLYDSKTKQYELPRVQKYELDATTKTPKLNAPMIAVSEDSGKSKDQVLSFKSICAVICFDLTGEGTLRQIQITSEDGPSLCGPFTPGTHGELVMDNPRCEFDYITLDCGKGVDLDKKEVQKFYISLPPGEYPAESLDIRFFDYKEKWGHCELKNDGKPVDLKPGCLYTLTWDVKFAYDPEYDPHYHSTDPHSVN